MNTPLVSIIIPCYNQAHFVRDALDSALAQDYPAFEVILVNDGSTDDLEAQVAGYRADARVRMIAQENRGLSAARNRGIQESRGDFVKFLDSDDWLAPTALTRLVQAFQTAPDQAELGLVYCDAMYVDVQGRPLPTQSVAELRRVLSGDILPSLLVGGYFPPSTVLVPRRVLEQVGLFDERLRRVEDHELWMRMMCEGYRALFVPEKLTYYRRHSANISLDKAQVTETHLRVVEMITTRYPVRVARALHDLISEHRRVDRDSAWARETLAAQQREMDAMKRALNTRGVRAVRAVERWSARWRR